jgi:N-acetylgalactosamine-6-sulfatase
VTRPNRFRRRGLRPCAAVAALALALGACRAGAPEAPAAAPQRPNLILLVADDLGWGDLASYGGDKIRTPRLDALAAGGMRWTQFYAASAMCTPSRSSLLTGRYPVRFGFTAHRGRSMREKLPAEAITLARLLRDAGYATAHVGKWHLGGQDLGELGFDRFLRVHYPEAELGGDESRLYLDGARYLKRNRVDLPPSDRFLTDALVDEALLVIDEALAAGKPFFLNLWFHAPHTPYNLAPEPCAAPYRGSAEGDDLMYRSLVSCMDAGIGRILDELQRRGIAESTFTIFLSDNGPSYQGDPGPWSGGKADLHEGGIRVPAILHWPARIAPAQVRGDLGHTNDILPTFCAAAGVPLPGDVAFDGVDLSPTFRGDPLPPRGPLFWQMELYDWYPQPGGKPLPHATEAVRDGTWKLFARDGVPLGLYDLAADPRESRDVMAENPERRDAMTAALRRWLDEAEQRVDR